MTNNKPSKLDTQLFQKILKKENKSQIQQKYLQNTLLMNVFYGNNIKNSYNSKVRRQINWKMGESGTKDLNRHLTKDVFYFLHFSSVASNSLWPHEPQHARPPCPSPTPRVYPNPCPSSRWCHPTTSSSVIPSSSCPQSFPASGSFPMSRFFASGGQSIGVSASTSALPMNTQDWSPLAWTGWISLQSKGLSRVFSNTTVQKHQFFGAQLPL